MYSVEEILYINKCIYGRIKFIDLKIMKIISKIYKNVMDEFIKYNSKEFFNQKFVYEFYLLELFFKED